EHIVLFTLHHIVSDGWSMGVLVREVVALYGALVAGRAGRPQPLPELPVQYADYAVWQRGWLQGEPLARQLAYWRQALGALPVLEPPLAHPRRAVGSLAGSALRGELPDALGSALTRLGRARGATLFMTLLAGFSALLSRYAGQDDVVVGSPIANRTHREI